MAESKKAPLITSIPLSERRPANVKEWLVWFFFEQNTAMSYITGFMFATCLLLLILQGIKWPLILWVSFYVLLTIVKTVYWYIEYRTADREVKRIEGDLRKLNQEIQEKRAYFDELRRQQGMPGNK